MSEEEVTKVIKNGNQVMWKWCDTNFSSQEHSAIHDHLHHENHEHLPNMRNIYIKLEDSHCAPFPEKSGAGTHPLQLEACVESSIS